MIKDGKMSINQCTITLTRNCNLRCDFCYAQKTGYNSSETISFDDLKKIVDFCDTEKVKYIVFTGGEPTLYPEIVAALKYIKEKKSGISPTIATNGIKLSDIEFCKTLIENGISYIDVSIKGNSSEKCIESTGCDCFNQQMKAINNLSILSADFTCSMVLTKENINYFCETVKIALDNGARQFSFTFLIDNEDSNVKDLHYLKENNPLYLIEQFFNHLDELNSITDEWWIEYSFPLCFYSDEQLSKLEGKLAAPCHVHCENGITFDTSMNLIPCNMFFECKMGKFGEEFKTVTEFEEFKNHAKYKSTIEEINKVPSESCRKCMHYDDCLGGCPITWKNYSYNDFVKYREQYCIDKG